MATFTYSFSTKPLRLLVSVEGVPFPLVTYTPNNPRLLIEHLRANPGTTFYEGDPPNGEFGFGLDGTTVEWVSGNYMQDAFGTLTNRSPVDPSFYRMLEDIAKL